MKKLFLAAAVASAVVASQANAAPYNITSNITDIGVTLAADPGNYLPQVDGVPNSLEFSGQVDVDVTGGAYTFNAGNIALNGVTSIDALGAEVVLTFIDAMGAATNNGTVMDSGLLDITAYGAPFETVDLSETPLNMTNTGEFEGVTYQGLPLGSGVVNPDGSITITLAGLPPSPEGAALADAVVAAELFGFPAAIFLGGTITLTEVPLPAAAWMFGSALVGLVGVARKRKTAAALQTA